MALSADREVDLFVDQELRTFKVGGGETIYKGGFVSVDASAYAAPLAAGEPFVGLAYAGVDNYQMNRTLREIFMNRTQNKSRLRNILWVYSVADIDEYGFRINTEYYTFHGRNVPVCLPEVGSKGNYGTHTLPSLISRSSPSQVPTSDQGVSRDNTTTRPSAAAGSISA